MDELRLPPAIEKRQCVRVAIKRAMELEQALSEPRLRDLNRVRDYRHHSLKYTTRASSKHYCSLWAWLLKDRLTQRIRVRAYVGSIGGASVIVWLNAFFTIDGNMSSARIRYELLEAENGPMG